MDAMLLLWVHGWFPVQALSKRNEQLEVELSRVAGRPLPPGASLSDFRHGEAHVRHAPPRQRHRRGPGQAGPSQRGGHGQIEAYRSADDRQVHIGGSLNAGLGGFEGGNGNGNGYLLATGHGGGHGDGRPLADKREFIAAVAALKADRRRFQQEVHTTTKWRAIICTIQRERPKQ